MDLSENLEICKFINTLRCSNEHFDSTHLKKEILRKNENNKPIYHLNFKEDDNLIMVYYDNLPKNMDNDGGSHKLENNTRSCIIDKETMKPIVTQFNKVIYNNDAVNYLKNKDWNSVLVEKCYEGTTIIVFHHKDKWYISTRRCLNANESSWVRNKSYMEMFYEAIEGKFTLDDLDKNNSYYFVLLHYKNKNIVNYSSFGDEYKLVIHTLTMEKYTIREIDYVINENVRKSEIIHFESMDDMLKELCNIDDDNKNKKKITTEGYIMRVYDGEVSKSGFTILKVQTDIYQTLMRDKPNNSNTYQSYLELYQKNKLKDYLVYFAKYHNLIIKRIHTVMRNLSIEILNLYHNTRKKKNQEIYNNLKDQYKKVLYGLHGLYIKMRKKDFQENVETDNQRSITIHDVYYYLKDLPPEQLRQLFRERMEIINENKQDMFVNKDCVFTKTMYVLMFPEEHNANNN